MNFFSLIFDQGCLLCGHQDAFSEKYGLCCSCAFPLLFARKRGPLCSVCGRPLISEDGICMRCRSRDYSFDRNSYFWEYSDNAKAVVGFYKFKGHRRVGRFLALCLWRLWPCARTMPALPWPARWLLLLFFSFFQNHQESICVLHRIHPDRFSLFPLQWKLLRQNLGLWKEELPRSQPHCRSCRVCQ